MEKIGGFKRYTTIIIELEEEQFTYLTLFFTPVVDLKDKEDWMKNYLKKSLKLGSFSKENNKIRIERLSKYLIK
ncbi:MAG: hypothetical protein EAX96_18630 [Candidatus Lokiarchaeota archaeon]|nr:hypothetical protein [Candidatus Lokiarchaeota archaeon]